MTTPSSAAALLSAHPLYVGRRIMKKTILYGLIIGSIWGIFPMTLSELMSSAGEAWSVIVAGAMTGCIVSVVLRAILPIKKKWKKIALGFMTLPFGSFLFGVIISYLHLAIESVSGISYRFIAYEFEPIDTGLFYAFLGTVSLFSIAFIPFAIFSTIGLNKLIENEMSNQTSLTTPDAARPTS